MQCRKLCQENINERKIGKLKTVSKIQDFLEANHKKMREFEKKFPLLETRGMNWQLRVTL